MKRFGEKWFWLDSNVCFQELSVIGCKSSESEFREGGCCNTAARHRHILLWGADGDVEHAKINSNTLPYLATNPIKKHMWNVTTYFWPDLQWFLWTLWYSLLS